MRGEDDGPAQGGVLADRLPEVASTLDIHALRRLVEEEEFRIGYQRDCKAEPLLFPSGALSHQAIRNTRDPRSLEYLLDRPTHGKQVGCVLHGFTHGEVLEESTGLHDGRDQSLGDGTARCHAVDSDISAGRL